MYRNFRYEDLVIYANKYGCKILDSEEIFLSNTILIKIKSKCGHNTATTLPNFVKKKIGIYCKDCMGNILDSYNQIQLICSNPKCLKKFISTPKSFIFCSKYCASSREIKDTTKKIISNSVKKTINEKNINRSTDFRQIHYTGNNLLLSILSSNFDFELTNRSDIYNHIYKIKNIGSFNNTYNLDKIWCPIEIKYSLTADIDNYYFSLKKKYSDQILLFYNIKNNKFWLFPPNSLISGPKLKINIQNKFTEYLVDNNDELIKRLNDYYTLYKDIHVSKLDNLTEKSHHPMLNTHVQVEYQYKLKRINLINFLHFQNPITNFETFNFLVNGYKVQECVCYISTKSSNQVATIHKKINGKTCPFDLTDNDFYWLNDRKDNYFYLMSSEQMYLKGFLSSDNVKGCTSICIETNMYWLNDYCFYYNSFDNIDNKNRLLSIFGLL